MSASTSLVRGAAARTSVLTASRTFPRASGSAYTAYLRRNGRNLPSHMTALAILVPQGSRYASTESRTVTNTSGVPPPGFNVDQAKKPLDDGKRTIDKPEHALNTEGEVDSIARDRATAVPKTDATDAVSLSELAGERQTTVTAAGVKKEEKKLTMKEKVMKELHHYWDGTKLLAAEVKISTRLALKMAAGYELSRRENRQLKRTVQDLGRLVPFSVFLIVPFAELLLPVALKLFPNLLPSTYEGQSSKDKKMSTLRSTRKEVSSFLSDTLKETGLPLSTATAQRDEFATFFRKVRTTGEAPSAEDVIKVCKIFKDDVTLDNLSRPQLVGMCRYMNLNTFGTDMMLRYQIRHRMRQIKRDDRAISFEGVESLSVPELQTACASRGIRTHGVSPGRLRDDLQAWLNLRLKEGVPSTLLVLSNAFMYAQGKESEIDTQIEALTGVLSSIPEELFHEIELEVHNAEGAATNKQRLEVIREQQELIKEEAEQDEGNKETGTVTPRDHEDIDEKEERRAEAELKARDEDEVKEEKNTQAAESEKETAAAPKK